MANDFSIVQQAALLARSTIGRLKFQLPMLSTFSHKFVPELKKGQKIDVIELGDGAVSDVDASGYTGDGARTDVNRSVTVTEHKKYIQDFSMDELLNGERAFMEEEGNRGAYRLAAQFVEDCIDTLMPLYTVNADFTLAGAETAMDYDDARLLGSTMRKAQIPGPYHAVINEDARYGLTGDTIVIDQNTNIGGNTIVQSQTLPNIAGISWTSYAGFPVLGAPEASLFGFAGSTDSMLIAAGAPPDIQQYLPAGFPVNYQTGVETDPDTGLSLRWYLFANGVTQAITVCFTLMYGFGVGRDAGMFKLYRA